MAGFQMNPFLMASMMRNFGQQGGQQNPMQPAPPVPGQNPLQPAPVGGVAPHGPVTMPQQPQFGSAPIGNPSVGPFRGPLPAGQVPMPAMGGAGMPVGMGMPQAPGAPFNPYATRMGSPPGMTYGPFGGSGMQYNGGMPTNYTPGATGAPGTPGAYPGSQFMTPEEAQQKQLLGGSSGLLGWGGGY